MSAEPTLLVNLDDPRQDVHRVRAHAPALHRYDVAERLLPPALGGQRVLELGGGISEMARRLIERGAIVSMIDLNPHNVERALQLGIDARQGDLNAGLPQFDSGTFDGVVMLEIIEHVVAAEQLLREVNRVLGPGGFVILSTPNFAFVLNRLRVLFGGLSGDEGYHFRFFTPAVLTRRLRDAGFAIEKHAHSSPAIGINIIRNRLLGRPRLHVPVPRVVAPLLAHALIVKAAKLASGLQAGSSTPAEAY
jgi:2-polyprenyl-3-methyl-5-hydroxy-6-metoxy-1,4-benzoquinol methylase